MSFALPPAFAISRSPAFAFVPLVAGRAFGRRQGEDRARQRPTDSVSVTSTVAALKASVCARNPATVTKLPAPSVSTLSSRSLPFCAVMRDPLVQCWQKKRRQRRRPLDYWLGGQTVCG